MSNAWSTTAGSRPTTGSTSMTSGFERALPCALAAMFACALSIGAWGAETAPGAPWSLEHLMQRLAQVKSAKVSFVERKHLRILNAALESSGTLVYTAPGL